MFQYKMVNDYIRQYGTAADQVPAVIIIGIFIFVFYNILSTRSKSEEFFGTQDQPTDVGNFQLASGLMRLQEEAAAENAGAHAMAAYEGSDETGRNNAGAEARTAYWNNLPPPRSMVSPSRFSRRQ